MLLNVREFRAHLPQSGESFTQDLTVNGTNAAGTGFERDISLFIIKPDNHA